MILISFGILISNFFILKKIIVIGHEDVHNLALLNNQNLLLLDEKTITRSLLESNQSLSHLTIEKKYPNIILINILPRKPFVVIKIDSYELVLDGEGIPLIKFKGMDALPVIEISGNMLLSKTKNDWRITKSLEMMKLLQKDYQVLYIQVRDQENVFNISFASGEKVIIPYYSEISMVVASLQVIIHRFRIEGKSIDTIDFRFDKPVVTFVNEDKNYPKLEL